MAPPNSAFRRWSRSAAFTLRISRKQANIMLFLYKQVVGSIAAKPRSLKRSRQRGDDIHWRYSTTPQLIARGLLASDVRPLQYLTLEGRLVCQLLIAAGLQTDMVPAPWFPVNVPPRQLLPCYQSAELQLWGWPSPRSKNVPNNFAFRNFTRSAAFNLTLNESGIQQLLLLYSRWGGPSENGPRTVMGDGAITDRNRANYLQKRGLVAPALEQQHLAAMYYLTVEGLLVCQLLEAAGFTCPRASQVTS